MSGRRLVPRLALSPEEAAESLGVSRSHFYSDIYPDLKVVRVGQRRLVPVAELERWLTRESARVLGEA